jgi:hypothetical protein
MTDENLINSEKLQSYSKQHNTPSKCNNSNNITFSNHFAIFPIKTKTRFSYVGFGYWTEGKTKQRRHLILPYSCEYTEKFTYIPVLLKKGNITAIRQKKITPP